jgi:predicted lipid-binding transport protein (Tim44 family)
VNFEIILLAMVAAFLGLRLYSVLGKRTGHEQEPVAPRKVVDDRQPAIVRQPIGQAEASGSAATLDADLVDFAANSGLRSIANADRQFDPALFLEGAKSAYGMVLAAYWR